MNNQVIMWIIFILSWATFFFMKKEDAKRFIPVAFLSVIYTTILVQIGGTFKWWSIIEPFYPLTTQVNVVSLNPVGTMWIFKFTYNRFWFYMAMDTVANIIFAYLFLGYFLPALGVFHFNSLGPFHVLIFHTIAGVLLYGYQLWQESIFISSKQTIPSFNLQPAATKPLLKKDNKEDSDN